MLELDADRERAARDVHPRTGRSPGAPDAAAEPDDIALLLHTSGTTSRPKLVPLTQRNLASSARNVAAVARAPARTTAAST